MDRIVNNIPQIRFSGFSKPWEQRKLGDIATFSKGKGYSKSDLSRDGNPIILYGRLYTKYETIISEVDTFAAEKDGSVYSSGGEVIVPASGETAEEISVASVVAKSGVLLGGDLNIISPSENLNPAFLAINITYGNPHNEMAKLAQGKTVVHLHNDDLKKIDLLYPSLEEQNQISEVFKSIDHVITLLQRKCYELKNYKSGLLQKMFPQLGESIPRIRFPGFTEPWKPCKLSELVDYSNGSGHEEYVVANGKYELITLKSIDSDGNLVSSGKYINEDFKTLSEGTIIMMLSEQAKGMLGMTTVIPSNNRYILNQRVASLVLHNNVDARFLTKAINNKQNYFELMGAGTKVQNISKAQVENCIIEIPDYEEQRLIGNFFKTIDNAIALKQQKCNELMVYKSGLLQKMLI